MSPETPAWNSNSHKDVEHHLDEEDKEEDKEVEGTITPVEIQKDTEIIFNEFQQIYNNIQQFSSCIFK